MGPFEPDLAVILEFIRRNTEWLYFKIYQNNFFFFDYWTFLHFFSGLMLPMILFKIRFKKIFLISFFFLVIYEIVEITLIYLAFHIFKPETIKDQITDIIVGSLGMLLINFARYAINLIANKNFISFYLPAILNAGIISFIWVGSYHYRYNVEILNTTNLNIWAFFWWFFGIIGITVLYVKVKNQSKSIAYVYSVIISFYLFALLLIEFIGYNILGIHEVSHLNSNGLLFNLIHGTKVMHTFYLIAPLVAIFLFNIFSSLFVNYFSFGKAENYYDNLDQEFIVPNGELES